MPIRTDIAVAAAVFALSISRPLAAQPSAPTPPPAPALLWHLPGEAVGTPAHDAEAVYVLDKNREVIALAPDTGHVKWRSGTGVTSSDAIFGLTTSGTNLVVSDTLVIAGDWDVVAFDKRSGARRWTYQAPAGDGPGLFLGGIAGSTVYAGSVSGRVYALDVDTGRPRWVARLEEGPMVSVFAPVVEGDRVAVGYSIYRNPNVGGLAVLDAASGGVRWRTAFPRPREPWRHTNRAGGPVIVGDLVFGSSGDGNIHAFDLGTGAVRWTLPRLEGPFAGYIPAGDLDHRTLVAAGRLLVAGSVTGKIVAYDIETRAPRWQHDAGPSGSTSFSFAADDARVYIPFLGGFIVALDAASGEEQWRVGDFNKGMIWAPDPAADRIFAAGSRAGVFAFTTRPVPPAASGVRP